MVAPARRGAAPPSPCRGLRLVPAQLSVRLGIREEETIPSQNPRFVPVGARRRSITLLARVRERPRRLRVCARVPFDWQNDWRTAESDWRPSVITIVGSSVITLAPGAFPTFFVKQTNMASVCGQRLRAKECLRRRTLIKCLVSDTVTAFTAAIMPRSLDLRCSRLDLTAVSDDATCELVFACLFPFEVSLYRALCQQIPAVACSQCSCSGDVATEYLVVRTAVPM